MDHRSEHPNLQKGASPAPVENLHQLTVRIADQYLERLIGIEEAAGQLLTLYGTRLEGMVQSLLRRKLLLYDVPTAAGYALVTALVDLHDWSREIPFLRWLEEKVEPRLEEADCGLALDWLDLQRSLHGKALWDKETARYVRSVHQLAEPIRKVYLLVVVEEKSLADAARICGLSLEETDKKLNEALESTERWMQWQEESHAP